MVKYAIEILEEVKEGMLEEVFQPYSLRDLQLDDIKQAIKILKESEK